MIARKRGLGSVSPERRKEIFAKRRQNNIAKYGSEEAFTAHMRSIASAGGKKSPKKEKSS